MATIAAAHGQHRLLPRTSTRASVSVRVTSVIIVVIAAVAAVSCVNAGVVDVALSFNQVSPLHVVDPLYLCFNIDTGSLFNGMDFSDKLLRAYTKQLAPAMLRIGGTAVDYSYYFPDTPYLVGQKNECASCGSGASAIGNEMCVVRARMSWLRLAHVQTRRQCLPIFPFSFIPSCEVSCCSVSLIARTATGGQ